MGKVCAQCKHFIGGGDWGLCCSKMHGLTYEDTDAANCDAFVQEIICKNNSRVVGGFRCSICGAYKSFVNVNGQVPIGEYVRLSRKAESLVKGLTECPMCGEELGASKVDQLEQCCADVIERIPNTLDMLGGEGE